jgi:predicted ATPase/DNA-binding winged helix-turn-helix (wHTH) protein
VEGAHVSTQALAYRFGRFRLLPDERLLLVDGTPARLGGRALDLLCTLIERRERTVLRDELFALVWPGRVVEEQNLKVQVLALRKVLGAQAIATVPGRGYRFALALDEDPAPGIGQVAAPPRMAPVPESGPILFGRVADIAALCTAVQAHRLVSIVGPGGIGKTRVAQAVAHQLRSRFCDGVWMVELASLAPAGEVAATIARTLGVNFTPGHAGDEGVAHALRAQSLLIVLDNCEHLLAAACSFADALLRSAPNAQLLVTSQEPLKHAEEHVVRLGGLDVPPVGTPAGSALAHGAVALLAARAHSADARFQLSDANVGAAIELCRALDGNALAIELAAARVSLLGVAGVRDRLGERFRLLTRGARDAPVRQQTLRAALQWSHGLLSPPEQAVFRRLGVFVGSFSLDAALRVARDAAVDDWMLLEHLGALVDKSLVMVEGDDPPRYRLLESARAFASERLAECGEAEATRALHLATMLDVFRRADDAFLTTPVLPWLDRLLPDLDNLRVALETARRVDPALAAELASVGAFFFVHAGFGAEGERVCRSVQATVESPAAPLPLRARYWLSVAHLGMGWMASARTALEAAGLAVALYRELDDAPRLYYALRHRVAMLERIGDLRPIPSLLEEMRGLEQPGWSPLLLRLRRWTEAHHLKLAGDVRACRDIFLADVQQALLEGDARSSWLAAHNVAVAEMALGNTEAAVAVMQSAVDQIHAYGLERRFATQVAMLANALVDSGDLQRAAPVVREAVSLLLLNNMLWWLCDALACVPALAGDMHAVARLHGWADARIAAQGGQRGLASQRLCDRVRGRLTASLEAEERRRLEAEGAALDDDGVVALVLRTLRGASGGAAFQ